MGRTLAAFPWGGSLCESPTVNGSGKKLEKIFLFNHLTFQRSVVTLALLHLGGIGSVLCKFTILPLSLFLSVTGCLLILLILSGYGILHFKTDPHSEAMHSELKTHAEHLEGRSKEFLDIVRLTTPTRTQALITEDDWAELTARISHDLRTPLNAVIGFSDLMRAETFGPLGHERYRDYLEHIQDSCRNLLKSAENTLALTSSLGKPSFPNNRDRISVFQLMKETEEFFRAEIQKKCVYLSYVIPSSLEILGDRHHLQQILINVFCEALAHVPESETLKVMTETSGSSLSLSLHVANSRDRLDFEQASLEICIARILLQQHGSQLCIKREKQEWSLTVFFDRATNVDFFALAANA